MELKLVRKHYGESFTEGKLFINNGFQCYTVEDKDRKLETEGCESKVQNMTCIPKGTYKVTISMSKRFNQFMIEVLDVPCFKGIRIHSGNSSADTEGCIIVGKSNTRDDDNWVGESRIAYEYLHKKVKEALSTGEEVTLEVC
ncbi:MAG: hypothetical protein JHC33_12195 [Ignisphaera sp.]|nr:hypothetical protein [Ignisphaera sp.]